MNLLSHGSLWIDTALVVIIACAGKFGGAALAARFCKLNWRESAAIGILMNTRGLMELVIVNLGRDIGVINNEAFAMMVLMAILTTALTTPILNWVYPRLPPGRRSGRARQNRLERCLFRAHPRLPPQERRGPSSNSPTRSSAAPKAVAKSSPSTFAAPPITPPIASGLDEVESRYEESLAPLLAQARNRGLPVEPQSFVSRDVPADISRIAQNEHINLVLMGFHKPVFSRGILGGTVHKVLTACPSDVAIFVDRGFRQARRILVPYLGSAHDRLALLLASRMARHSDAPRYRAARRSPHARATTPAPSTPKALSIAPSTTPPPARPP